MKQAMQKAIIEYLSAKGFRCFAMGSVRFGYENPDSDVDICVFAPYGGQCDPHEEMGRLLENRGFTPEIRTDHGYPGTLWSFGKIHVVVLTDKEQFDQLEKEHDRIEQMINENPILLDMLKVLHGTHRVIGRTVYRSLVEVFELNGNNHTSKSISEE